MAFAFGDSFDLYAAIGDPLLGYWDGSTNTSGATLIAGRFTSSQALSLTSGASVGWYKNSGNNDAVHHIVVSFRQTAGLTGTSSCLYISLGDGATAQCSIVFRSDGAMLLTTGGPTGATLDTYTGAVTAQNAWIAFEVEVVINNTTGSWAVRKNGNTSNDHALGSLNTRGGTTNNYASRMTIGMQVGLNSQIIDDLLWRSDPTSVPWVGDVRCYTQMPASDASVQFSKSPTSVTVNASTTTANQTASVANTIYMQPYGSAPHTGMVTSIQGYLNAGVTGHTNMAMYDTTGLGGGPGALMGSATAITNPTTGLNIFTVATPFPITRGQAVYIAINSDVASGASITGPASNSNIRTLAAAYSGGFPSSAAGFASTTLNGFAYMGFSTAPINSMLVNEAQQDGTTTYVYDSTVGHNDLYSIQALPVTPSTIVAVTTRGFMEKSDAGSRSGQMQLKSGTTTVQAPTLALATNFLWNYRTDMTDPNTSAAWTGSAVNALQIGPYLQA